MPALELTATHLIIRLSPLEKLAALSGDITLPAMAIRGATVADKNWWRTLGMRVGTGLVGVVIAGRFYRKSGTTFVSWVRKAGLPLEITLAPAAAKASGATELPQGVKELMRAAAKVMTTVASRV